MSIRINSGGSSFSFNGISWNNDSNYSGSNTYSNNSSINGTNNDQLYQSERYGKILIISSIVYKKI